MTDKTQAISHKYCSQPLLFGWLHSLYYCCPVKIHLCFSFASSASFPPNRAYPDGGMMSEIRYTYTQILIVTCYLLLAVISACCTFAMPSLCLRSESAPRTIGRTDLQRTYNGPTTELHWRELKVLAESH